MPLGQGGAPLPAHTHHPPSTPPPPDAENAWEYGVLWFVLLPLRNGRKSSKNYSTSYSHVFSHRSTDDAVTSLTSEIGRDPVLSSAYGRSCMPSPLQRPCRERAAGGCSSGLPLCSLPPVSHAGMLLQACPRGLAPFCHNIFKTAHLPHPPPTPCGRLGTARHDTGEKLRCADALRNLVE